MSFVVSSTSVGLTKLSLVDDETGEEKGYATFLLSKDLFVANELYTHPEHRNQGVAQAIVNEITLRWDHLLPNPDDPTMPVLREEKEIRIGDKITTGSGSPEVLDIVENILISAKSNRENVRLEEKAQKAAAEAAAKSKKPLSKKQEPSIEPGLHFVNDRDSGFRRKGTNEVAVTINGADGLIVDTTGITVPNKSGFGSATINDTYLVAPSDTTGIGYKGSITAAGSNGSDTGIYSSVLASGTAYATKGALTALVAESIHTATVNATGVISGITGAAILSTADTASTTLQGTGITGYVSDVSASNTSVVTGVFANVNIAKTDAAAVDTIVAAFRGKLEGASTYGAITSSYGLLLEDPDSAIHALSTNTYGVYSAGNTHNVFEGNVHIGNTISLSASDALRVEDTRYGNGASLTSFSNHCISNVVDVNSAYNTSTSVIGINNVMNWNNTASGAYYVGNVTVMNVANVATTLPAVINTWITAPIIGAAATVSQVVGLYISDQGSYAASNYNIYSAGASQINLFEGPVISPSTNPVGGSIGQVLTKDSGADYDYSWQTPSGGPAGASKGFVVAMSVVLG